MQTARNWKGKQAQPSSAVVVGVDQHPTLTLSQSRLAEIYDEVSHNPILASEFIAICDLHPEIIEQLPEFFMRARFTLRQHLEVQQFRAAKRRRMFDMVASVAHVVQVVYFAVVARYRTAKQKKFYRHFAPPVSPVPVQGTHASQPVVPPSSSEGPSTQMELSGLETSKDELHDLTACQRKHG